MCWKCISHHSELPIDHEVIDFKNYFLSCDCNNIKVANIFCEKCQSCVCQKCYFIKHNLHAYKPFDEVFITYSKNYESKINELEQLISNLNEREKEAETFITSINDKINDLIEKLQVVKLNYSQEMTKFSKK